MRVFIISLFFLVSLPILASGPSLSADSNIGVRLISPANAAFATLPLTKLTEGIPASDRMQTAHLGSKASTNSFLVLVSRLLPGKWSGETPVIGTFNPVGPNHPSMPLKAESTKPSRDAATLMLAYN